MSENRIKKAEKRILELAQRGDIQALMQEAREFHYGRQADNPQIDILNSLHDWPEDQSFGGWKDERLISFAANIEKAVRELDADFFQDLADAAEELRCVRAASKEALHFAKGFIRDARREGRPIVKGEIREQIEELWANQFSTAEDGPTEEDKERAKRKGKGIQWSRDVYKPAGIEDAAKKPKPKKRIG